VALSAYNPTRCLARGGGLDRLDGIGTMRPNTLTLLALMTALCASATAQLSSKETAAIDALFTSWIKPDAPGASVMVIHSGKAIFAKGYGLADLEKRIPCNTNTNFRLASVTKQFTAMAVLMLAERKKLSLDERLMDFFPEFPAYGRAITVRHLLTHTSGLVNYEDEIPPGTTLPVLDQDVLRIEMRQTRTYFAPGTQYRYSNSAYALLALIVEQRSGQTFACFLKQHIFAPLKMANTLAYEEGLSVVPNRAFGHSPAAGDFTRTDQSLTSSVLGDGGIYSSVVDLAKWDAVLYTTKLVRRKTLEEAFTPAVATDKPGRSYGFGWYLGEYRGLRAIWHSGETRGFRTRLARFPERKFAVIILANRSDAVLEEFPGKIADIVLFGKKP
jgi:CubicO group peptidase (beta-lactamase class C family)